MLRQSARRPEIHRLQSIAQTVASTMKQTRAAFQLDRIAICNTIWSRRSTMAKRATTTATTSPLMVRLDAESKQALTAAAELRRISVSDYVRTVTVAQARREVASARDQAILLSPDEQVAFWQALNAPSKLTPAQKRLGAIMRGEK
jgi:uncharacterized protein (DUF1778 family)